MAVQEPIRLEYRMRAGEVQEYRAHIDSEQILEDREEKSSASSTADIVILQKVMEFQPPDLYGLQVTVASGTVRRGGGEAREIPLRGQAVMMTLRKNGEIVKASVEMPFSQPAFPDRSLRQGDTWTVLSELVVPQAGADGQMVGVRKEYLSYNYSLWGFRRILGYDCAQIHVACPRTGIELQRGIDEVISAAGTTFFAYREGKLVRSEVETDTHISSPDSSISTRIRVVLELYEAASTGMAVGGEEFIMR